MPGSVYAHITACSALQTPAMNQGSISAALWLRAEHFPGVCEATGAQRGEATRHRLHSQPVVGPSSDAGCVPLGLGPGLFPAPLTPPQAGA